MVIELLKKVWSLLSKLSPDLKNLIIIVLFFIVSITSFNGLGKRIVNDVTKSTMELRSEAESYSKKMTPVINENVYHILMSDQDACNVLLLSYHNSQSSMQGFSYLWITGITEEGRWNITEPYIRNWTELSAINYGNELDRIHKLKYLRIDDIENIKDDYPKLYFKLRECDAKSAAFYPIQSRNNIVGMLVILYKKSKEYDLGYYMETIEPCITELYSILNYSKEKENMK